MRTWISIVGLSFVLAAGANAQIKYAGIYFGDLSGDYYSDSGAIAVMVRSNKQASLVGSAYGTNNQIGIFAQFKVQDDGTWSFNTNGTSGTGQVFTDGTITANINFSDGGVSTLDNGTLQDDLGPYQNQAGLYAGSWSGGGQSGKLFAVLSALGEIDLCAFDPGNQPMDGGGPGGPLDTSNSFDFLTVTQAELAGTLTRSTLTIAGTWTSTGANGVFHLARTARGHLERCARNRAPHCHHTFTRVRPAREQCVFPCHGPCGGQQCTRQCVLHFEQRRGHARRRHKRLVG